MLVVPPQIESIAPNGVRKAQYSSVVRYKSSSDGVETGQFLTFLIIILIIWLMVLFTEIRACLKTFECLFFMPVASPQTREDIVCSIDHNTGEIAVLQLKSAADRWMLLLFMQLPRTLLLLGITYVGTR